jgi:transposase-like protein
VIVAAYVSGTNTRRVRRPLGALFKGAVSKDTMGRTWRKTDWEAWCRSLADEDVVRLIVDVRVRLDRKAISLLVVLGIRRDGQKAVLYIGDGSEVACAVCSMI